MMLTDNSWTTLTAQAAHQGGAPMFVEFYQRFETEEEATAFAAQFPKSYTFRTTSCRGKRKDGNYGIVWYGVKAIIHLASIKGNEKNETGIKRYHSIMAKAAKLGIDVMFDAPCPGQYATREEFESAIA